MFIKNVNPFLCVTIILQKILADKSIPADALVQVKTFIKTGLHNLLNAHFDLRNHRAFEKTLKHFEQFAKTDRVKDNDNFRILAFIYISIARINRHFMQGSFSEGLALVPAIEEK